MAWSIFHRDPDFDESAQQQNSAILAETTGVVQSLETAYEHGQLTADEYAARIGQINGMIAADWDSANGEAPTYGDQPGWREFFGF